MCSTCGGRIYGQDQSDARRADKEKLDRVRKARENKLAQRENANLN